MDKMQIYNHLPVWGQNIACYYEGKKIVRTRYGHLFWDALHEYEKHDKWSYDQVCDYRDKRLKTMIHHCYNTVPYYTRLFDEYGINPDSIKELDDLKRIPLLTKDIVNRNPQDFISSKYKESDLLTYHTSGTTGTGFVFKLTKESLSEQWAIWWRYRRRLGIEYGTWSANFGTRMIVPITHKKPPFWRYNKPCKQVYFSAFHEKPENLDYYIEEIISKNLSWIHGYPSLITSLANRILQKGINLKGKIKYVTLGAENLLSYQERIMTNAFGVKPYQHYGMSEGVANFSQFPNYSMLVDEDYAAVEFIPFSDTYKIIGTTLSNFAMPLIRWDIKDTANYKFKTGVGRMITSIDGRIEDYITLPDGTQIGKLDHLFKDTVLIKEAQIRQKPDYSIIVNYVADNDVDVTTDLEIVNRLLKESCGRTVRVSYERVSELEKTQNGKLRFIVSEVGK